MQGTRFANLSKGASNPCRPGHDGVFCAACDWPRYRKNSDTKLCELCDGDGSMTMSFVYPLGGFLVVLGLVCFAIVKSGNARKPHKFVEQMVRSKSMRNMTAAAAMAATDDGMNAAAKAAAKQSVSEAKAYLASDQEESDPMKELIWMLRPILEPRLKRWKLTWHDVEPDLSLVDTVEELQDAIKEPEAFLQRMLVEASGPAAIRLARSRLKPILEPRLRPPLVWTDVECALQLIGSIDELRAAVEEPDALLERVSSAATTHATLRAPLGGPERSVRFGEAMPVHVRTDALFEGARTVRIHRSASVLKLGGMACSARACSARSAEATSVDEKTSRGWRCWPFCRSRAAGKKKAKKGCLLNAKRCKSIQVKVKIIIAMFQVLNGIGSAPPCLDPIT